MKRSIRMAGAPLLALAAVLVFVTTSGAATPPPPLTGEFLLAGSTSQAGGTFVTSATCSQVSPSTIAFTASGTVGVGNYPGSFSESGFVTVSTTPSGQFVDGLPLYQVSSVDVFFTINSVVGDVTGTKHLLPESGIQALCDTFSGELFGNTDSTVKGFFRELIPGSDGFGLSYDAIITTPDGVFEDTGIAGLLFSDLEVNVLSGNLVENSNVLNEAFRSTGLTAVTLVGDATGGGQISSNGNAAAFGFEARSQGGRLKGQCDVVDKAAGVKLHCSDVTTFYQLSATKVRFFGNATINGSATTYEIDVQDLADSGIGSDTFTVSTGAGYSAGGTLTAGNVQIHGS
jgi:hypothetical protein